MNLRLHPGRICGFILLFLLAFNNPAYAVDLGEYGKVTGDFRYRYENVDQDGIAQEADANTARLRLGYETPTWKGLKLFGEVEIIRHVFAEHFNDGLNGQTAYPRVNDPDLTDINQLYLDYKEGGLKIRIGRQGMVFDNQRFVGWSKWRQNDSTFDAALVQYDLLDDLKLSYAYAINFHRYSGHRSTAGEYEGNMHMLHAHYDVTDAVGVSAYTYLLGFTQDEEDLSSRTHGVRVTYDPKGDGWLPYGAVDFARQSDYGDSTLSYDESLYSIEAGLKRKDLKISATFEHVGGDGTAAAQTPVASTHSLLGWTDKFGTIPVEGLRDMRVQASVPFALPWEGQKLTVIGQLHRFTSATQSLHYGNEQGIALVYTPVANHDITAKFSHYNADERFTDTSKFWLQYEWKF